MSEEARQALADLQRAPVTGGISPNASPVDIAGDESADSLAQVFMRPGVGDELGDAAQQMASTTMPSQIPLVAHAGDLVTSFGLILVTVAEAMGRRSHDQESQSRSVLIGVS
jgi:hypothetical protein